MAGTHAKGRCGFTLVELLVAIAVIAVLSALTVVAVRGISSDARLSGGINTVTAVLARARTEAMKSNKIVLVVFRPRFVGDREQVVEAILAEWTGETYVTSAGTIDRFVPVAAAPPRGLPRGIKVAGPRYGETDDEENLDDAWVTQTHLPAIDQSNPIGPTSEEPGQLVAVMYDADGTSITRNARTDSNFTWIDFEPDWCISWRGTGYGDWPSHTDCDSDAIDPALFDMYLEADESFVNIAPFISVYDDEEAREERQDPQNWTTPAGYQELTGPEGLIARKGRRIHFNRYTGVVVTVEDR